MKRLFAITNRALTAVAPLALAVSVALAQQPQTPKGMVIKGKTPVNKDVLKVTLPKIYVTKLSNGLPVIVLENHKLPTFAMRMIIGSGGLNTPASQSAAADYTAAMLLEGTKTRASKQIAKEIDSLGATLSASSGLTSLNSTVEAVGLTKNFDQIMELFADVILNPSFPAEDLNKLKNSHVARLRSQRSDPNFLANEMFSKVIYGLHPESRVAPTPAQIQELTPDLLRQFHAAYYKPNNAIFAIVGDVKPDEIAAKLEKTFGTWQPGAVPQLDLPKVNEPGPSKIYLIDRPGSEQTILILGNLVVERNDPDSYALKVMNQVLGGGDSSRLLLNLRLDKGYTYGAYSKVSGPEFRASTAVKTDVTKASMDALIYEFKRLCDEKTPADELDRAKLAIVMNVTLLRESPDLQLIGDFYLLPADYWSSYQQKIMTVTSEDVQRVARKYLDPTKLQIVAVGDAKRIADVMKQCGTVELYDTEGKPLQSPLPVATGDAPDASGDFAAIIGKWNLTASSPNVQVALKLEIKSKGAEIGGALDTPFGQFAIISASVQGSDVTIKFKADLHGNPAEIQIAGKLEGATMKGSLTSAGLPTLDFTGEKEK
ncbi:MAG TPA: pitrilysin family protein [Blastocatellia bacterium]|nr:pitrilysin family protein [Blastocatellia bacterium]